MLGCDIYSEPVIDVYFQETYMIQLKINFISVDIFTEDPTNILEQLFFFFLYYFDLCTILSLLDQYLKFGLQKIYY